MDCETETGNIFTQTNAISKQKKNRNTRLAPNKSTFKGLQNYLRISYFYEDLLAKLTAKLKVRLFFLSAWYI